MKRNHFPFVMKFIAACTAITTLILAAFYHRYQWNALLPWAISFGTTAYHFIMRLAVGYITQAVTRYDFDYKSTWFQPRTWEPGFYQTIGIKHWKKGLPTYAPGQFSMAENSLHRIIQNMCGAEIVHEVIMVLSFLPLLMVPVFGDFPVFLITSVAAAGYDGIFVMAQRFNRPRLVRILEKQTQKAPLCKGSCQKSI